MRTVLLECIDVSKQYNKQDNNEYALKKVSLNIFSEDFTVIMGSSGSGKSTLLQCISGMDKPTTGSIKFNSICITRMDDSLLSNFRKQNIGFVFQNMNLIEHFSTLENVTFPGLLLKQKQTSEVISDAKSLIDKVGLGAHLKKLPFEMSGGQQQRVAVARALINSPQILFADEPTGALNSKSGIQILDILSEMNGNGQSIVMVTHDLKAALRANRIIYLKDGIIEGELNLNKYDISEMDNREEKVLGWLKERGW